MQAVLREIKKKRVDNLDTSVAYKKREITIENGTIIDIYEDTEGGVAGSLWESVHLVISHLVSLPVEFFANKRSIELGSGVGLGGMALAIYPNQTEVILTDLCEALPLLQYNVKHNETLFRSPVKVQALEWGKVDDSVGTFDIILVSDCIYNIKNYGDYLLETITSISDSNSNAEEEAKFLEKAGHAFDIKKLPESKENLVLNLFEWRKKPLP